MVTPVVPVGTMTSESLEIVRVDWAVRKVIVTAADAEEAR
jgi:hypothetical protein